MSLKNRSINLEDATRLLIQWLKKPDHGNFGKYGYDVYIPHLLRLHLIQKEGIQHPQLESLLHDVMPVFFNAGWDLCRRGILRPGASRFDGQALANPVEGYCITPYGQKWLDEYEHDESVPTEPGRFADMLSAYKGRFGDGFHERAQEAVKCYQANSFLACCVMCGAATESILLSIAIHKTKDEDRVLKNYRSANGRKNIENLILGQSKSNLVEQFHVFTSLLKYWRDEAAHGQSSKLKENEAWTSLILLLRFAIFAESHWDELVIK